MICTSSAMAAHPYGWHAVSPVTSKWSQAGILLRSTSLLAVQVLPILLEQLCAWTSRINLSGGGCVDAKGRT